MDRHDVLLFVVIACAKNFIDDVPVAREKDKSFAGLVESTYRKNTLGVFDEIDDVVLLAAHIGGAHDTDGLVQGDIDMLFAAGLDGLTIDPHIVALFHFRTHLGHLAVDGDTALLDEDIRRTSRAKADFTEVFVDARFQRVRK